MLNISYFHTNTETQRPLHHLSRASLMTQMARNAAAGLPISWRRWTEWSSVWLMSGMVLSKLSLMC